MEAKDAFMQQVELAWATKERLGLQGDANKIAELMGGDTALMQEAIKLAMDENYYGQVHENSPNYQTYLKVVGLDESSINKFPIPILDNCS